MIFLKNLLKSLMERVLEPKLIGSIPHTIPIKQLSTDFSNNLFIFKL